MKQRIASLLLALGFALGLVVVAGGTAAASPVCPNAVWLSGRYGSAIKLPADSSYRTFCHLQRGAGGTGVRTLQESIYNCYYRYGPDGVRGRSVFNIARDGSYGGLTEAAVRAVQSYHRISADGIYGPQTRNYMVHYGNTGSAENCDWYAYNG